MVRKRSLSSPVDELKTLRSLNKKEQVAFLKDHHLLRTCSKDNPEMLPKVGELVWARVLGSVFWPGFILELTDVEKNVDGADDIDDSAYGFVMFLEKTYRYAPVAWDQMIPFQDMDTQMKLLPYFNKMVVKKSWKPTSVYKASLDMAIEFSKLSEAERLDASVSRYEMVKKLQTISKAAPSPATSANKPARPSESEIPPEEAISKVVLAAREKKKSGIRVSERITKKQIVKLKPNKSTAKKTEKTSNEKAALKSKSNKSNKNTRPDIGGEILKEWTRNRFNSFSKQYLFESSNVHCGECNAEIVTEEAIKTCHGMPYHIDCLLNPGDGTLKCKMCTSQQCFLCKQSGGEKEKQVFKCSRCELRFHIDCLLKDWPQAEIQGSNGPITCPMHFCHTCLGEQKIFGKFRDYTTSSSRSYKCRLCLSAYHKTCLPAGCGESVQGKEYIVCPKHTLPELKVHQRRIGCLGCCKALKPKEEKVECSYCTQAFHPACVGYTDEIRKNVSLEVFGQGYKCYSCKWGLFPLYGQIVWFQQPQHQYWPARILFPTESKNRKHVAKRLPGQYSIEYFGSTLYYDNASRALPLHLTTVEIFKTMKVYQEVPKILRAHEEASFCFMFTEEYRDKQLQKPKPVYKKIERNVYRTVSVQKVREPADACSCSDEKTPFVCQADSGCTNRDMEMECSDRICKGGTRCSNRMFSERKNDEEFLEQKLFSNKGWGVIAKKPFKPGDFVAEYRGEVIDRNEMKWRLSKKEEEDPMYILEISKEFFIDAEYVGNLSRLINHSCDPNCEVRKYLSLGKSVGGIFARRSIEVGEEVTFRYGCGSQSTAPFRCRCGAKNCTVFVGKDVPEDYRVDEDPEQSQDKWDDVCSKCGFGGRVICCEFPGCGKVWHYQCVNLTRQPRKNWCCPEHPARKVAQLKKANETRKKLSKPKSNGSSKNPTPVQQQAKKKSRQNAPPVAATVKLEDEIPEKLHTPAKEDTVLKPSNKRKLSEETSTTESLQPAQKKRRVESTASCSSESAQNAQEKPTPIPVNQSARKLRSSKTISPTPAHKDVEDLPAPATPQKSKSDEAISIMEKILRTPSPVGTAKAEGRRRRAQSIPANGFRFSVPSTPNTRSMRTRRGESVNERSIVFKKLDEDTPTQNLFTGDSSTGVAQIHEVSDDLKSAEVEMSTPRMSRRRSRNCKTVEPFSPLALNPYVRPREPPTVILNTHSTNDKHARMGTRSTSTCMESPVHNQINGQTQTPNGGIFTNGVGSLSMTLEDLKQEVYEYEEDSYLEYSLEQTRNKRTRFDHTASDASSTASTRSCSTILCDTTEKDAELQICYDKTKPNQRILRQYPAASYYNKNECYD